MTQQELDAACEWVTDWIFENAPHPVYDDWMSDRADFCKAMSSLPNEEIDEEYNPTYDEAYLQSKIGLVTEARRKDGLTSEQMLAELRGGTCNSEKNLQELIWQDVKKLVEISRNTPMYGGFKQAHYIEVLRRFNRERNE